MLSPHFHRCLIWMDRQTVGCSLFFISPKVARFIARNDNRRTISCNRLSSSRNCEGKLPSLMVFAFRKCNTWNVSGETLMTLLSSLCSLFSDVFLGHPRAEARSFSPLSITAAAASCTHVHPTRPKSRNCMNRRIKNYFSKLHAEILVIVERMLLVTSSVKLNSMVLG